MTPCFFRDLCHLLAADNARLQKKNEAPSQQTGPLLPRQTVAMATCCIAIAFFFIFFFLIEGNLHSQPRVRRNCKNSGSPQTAVNLILQALQKRRAHLAMEEPTSNYANELAYCFACVSHTQHHPSPFSSRSTLSPIGSE